MVVLSLCTLPFLLLVNHCGGRRRGRHNPTPHPEQVQNHPVWAKEILDPCYVHLRGTDRVKRDIEVELDWFSNLSPSLSTPSSILDPLPSPLLDPLPFSSQETTPPSAVGFSTTIKNSLLNLRSLVGLAASFMVSPPPFPSRYNIFPFPLFASWPQPWIYFYKTSWSKFCAGFFDRRVSHKKTEIIIFSFIFEKFQSHNKHYIDFHSTLIWVKPLWCFIIVFILEIQNLIFVFILEIQN